MPRSPVAAALREARTTAGISRERAAIHVGKSWSSIRSYENGAVVPPLSVLVELADFYGVTAADLLSTGDSRVA